MKITHISLNGPVTDNFTYQDNLLPKYHKINGNNVSMITSKFIYDSNGVIAEDSRDIYINEYGIKTIRLKTKGNSTCNSKFKIYIDLYENIEREKPDIIFIHGCQFLDIITIVKYLKKNSGITVYVDNHADNNNSAKNWISENILHKVIWRYFANKIEPYVEKFYGVLPARVEFLSQMYKIPRNKLDLLVMGADDEIAEKVKTNGHVDKFIRDQHGIKESEFLIVTGGKIDNNKKEILRLMKAINHINNEKVQLLIFGSITPNLKEEFNSLLSARIKYIGWAETDDIYNYFAVANLVVFPGLHSVLWEQAVGLGSPCLFKYIEGFTHVDLGGNCKFLYEDNYNEMCAVLSYLINKKDEVNKMKQIAEEYGVRYFSYKNIAMKSISR